MGLVMMEGSPFSPLTNGTGGGCVYEVTTDANGVNTDLITLNPSSGQNATDVLGTLATPTDGTGTPFDEITQTLERSASSISTFLGLVTGGYITAFIEKTAIGCEKDTDPNSPTFDQFIPVDNPVWEGFKLIFHTIILFLIALQVFYILSGRGFILTS